MTYPPYSDDWTRMLNLSWAIEEMRLRQELALDAPKRPIPASAWKLSESDRDFLRVQGIKAE